ncbi:MAG: 5-formyltetrahydrofolate cyclo-ligase [Alistipes sp.]
MESKSALRRIVRDRGELYDGRTRAAMSQRVMEAVGRFPPFADAASVALYWSLPAEVDTHAFVEKWAVRKKVYLPVMRGDGLSLRKFTGRNELREARFGIREPVGEEETCLRRIDLIVVPAMGYDPYGNRLGHGKGFYDRLLTRKAAENRRLFRIPVFRACSADAHDVPVDWVVCGSEREARWYRDGALRSL